MDENEIYQKAIDKFGHESQVKMAIEECGELIVALMHLGRGRVAIQSVIEEIADVEIIMGQLRVLFGSDEVDRIKGQKLEKLRGMINNES